MKRRQLTYLEEAELVLHPLFIAVVRDVRPILQASWIHIRRLNCCNETIEQTTLSGKVSMVQYQVEHRKGAMVGNHAAPLVIELRKLCSKESATSTALSHDMYRPDTCMRAVANAGPLLIRNRWHSVDASQHGSQRHAFGAATRSLRTRRHSEAMARIACHSGQLLPRWAPSPPCGRMLRCRSRRPSSWCRMRRRTPCASGMRHQRADWPCNI